jgi:glycosyltransferase involved in cell wall biosynthesis
VKVSTDKNLTICVLTWNEEERIGSCLQSLQPCDADILIVDNGSTDRTLEIVSRFSNIRVLRSPENNLGRARAMAVAECETRWIAFIDADCIAPPGWASRLRDAWLNHVEKDPNTVAVGGGNRPPETGAFYRALRTMLESTLGHLRTSQAFCPTETRKVTHLPTCNVLYERSAIIAAGNFSSRFKKVCEDLELNQRLHQRGRTFYQISGLEVEHRHSPGFSAWARKMFLYGYGQIQVMRLHPLHFLSIKSLPFFAAAAGVALLVISPFAAMIAVLAYLAGIAVYSGKLVLKRGEEHKIPAIARLTGLFVITHLCYAFGEVCGVIVTKAKQRSGR